MGSPNSRSPFIAIDDMKKILIILFCSIVLLDSCTEEVKPVTYDYTKVFTGENNKVWKIEKLVLREVGKQDAQISLSTCEKDDEYTFYNNGERLFEVTNGNLACDSGEEDMLVSYVWAFSNSSATLTMVTPHIFGNFLIPFIVKKATKSAMELEIFLDEEATISYVLFFEVVDEN
jgi:hypothetical protein